MTQLITVAIVVLLVIAVLVADGWFAFGKRAVGERKLRVESATGWSNGKFRNKLPLKNNLWRSIRDSIISGRHKVPREDIKIFQNDGSIYLNPPSSGLRVSWLGHSSLLLELDDVILLIDPLWGRRVSPFSWIGSRRWYESPLAFDDLPEIDAVLISHDHYDHLDRETIEALAVKVSTFIVPLGVGAHLAYWGVPNSAIIELEWWQQYDIGSIQVVSTPARHASGRWWPDIPWQGPADHAVKSTQLESLNEHETDLINGR